MIIHYKSGVSNTSLNHYSRQVYYGETALLGIMEMLDFMEMVSVWIFFNLLKLKIPIPLLTKSHFPCRLLAVLYSFLVNSPDEIP